jgi:glycosyltransferase involved in cell wall biosynthesis
LSEFIHIVCLDAPGPPDYGGAIDMSYKIKALSEKGKKIILHYFDYNNERGTAGLEQYCASIYSYRRKPIYRSLPLSQPFIVQSRINQELIKRLNQDDYPILLEGLHCSGIISFLKNPQRVVLRMHNDEASYYHHLAQTEASFLKRKYFQQESKLLKRYQSDLNNQIILACLSQTDIETFKNDYHFQEVHFIPCSIPWQEISINPGKGTYCLYHGNMSVSENEEAALWLIKHVFSALTTTLLIAGKGISNRLKKSSAPYKHIQLIDNPSIAEIDELIRNAHINVLPSMNNTGVKLKLLNALLNGRHCITNFNGIKGSKIEAGLLIEDDPSKWVSAISKAMKEDFSAQQIEIRKEILFLYNNQRNAAILNELW